MILCAGEALIDMVPVAANSGAQALLPTPGGAVYNTAIALGRLGARAGFVGAISSDFLGERLMAGLRDAGVDTALVQRPARPTTLAFVDMVDGQARYAFCDEASAGRMISRADFPALPAATCALFCGGISLMVQPCGATFEDLMLGAPEGVVCMIDPNIRPAFIGDEAGYRARLARMIARADLVKLSDEDLFWLEGAGDMAAQAEALRKRGPKIVFVTQGARGAHAFSAAGAQFQPARQVVVGDSVGAGDTFNAGVLAALSEAGALSRQALLAPDPDHIAASLALGQAAAAVTVARIGADPPWRSELSP